MFSWRKKLIILSIKNNDNTLKQNKEKETNLKNSCLICFHCIYVLKNKKDMFLAYSFDILPRQLITFELSFSNIF